MSATERDNVPFELIEDGSGTTVVILVHGSASDRRTWDAQRRSISQRFRVVSYSRRYHWPNPPASDEDDYSMVEHADDLEAVLTSVGTDSVHLVGHSYGGFVALLVAIRRPDLVSSLVLIEPPVVPLFLSQPPRPQELLSLLAKKPRLAFELVKFAARGLGPATKAAEHNQMDKAIQIFGPAVLGRTAFAGLSPTRWDQVVANNIRAEYTGSGFAPLAAEEVAGIAAPALLVTGQYSPKLWRLLIRQLDSLLPDSSIAEIPNASHIAHEDNPDAFNRAVLRFLDGHT